MNDEGNTVKVDPSIETICCDGGQDEIGHPAVYYTFGPTRLFVATVVKFILRIKINKARYV